MAGAAAAQPAGAMLPMLRDYELARAAAEHALAAAALPGSSTGYASAAATTGQLGVTPGGAAAVGVAALAAPSSGVAAKLPGFGRLASFAAACEWWSEPGPDKGPSRQQQEAAAAAAGDVPAFRAGVPRQRWNEYAQLFECLDKHGVVYAQELGSTPTMQQTAAHMDALVIEGSKTTLHGFLVKWMPKQKALSAEKRDPLWSKLFPATYKP